MDNKLPPTIAPTILPVGTVVKIKVHYQHWIPGTLGVCFDITEFIGKTGIFIIFEDGECGLFNAVKIPDFFDVVGYSTENCLYRYEGYSQIKQDFLMGIFCKAFALGRQEVSSSMAA